jgi:hypothetical protein
MLDRYSLPLIPPMVILGLVVFEDGRRKVPVSCWIVACLFAGFSIAATHDYYASLRARVAAFRSLQQKEVPANRISGGFELDSVTELNQSGHLNNPLVQFPEGAYREIPHTNPFWFGLYTPTIRPRYFLAWSPTEAGLDMTDVSPAVFRTWFPPFRRQVLTFVTHPSLPGPPPASSPPAKTTCLGAIELANGYLYLTAGNLQVAGGDLLVQGWTAMAPGISPDSVFVTLSDDVQILYFDSRSKQRPDVYKVLNWPYGPDLGFSSLADVSALHGTYRLGLARMYNGRLEVCRQFDKPIFIH